jgi:hypothetical protein
MYCQNRVYLSLCFFYVGAVYSLKNVSCKNLGIIKIVIPVAYLGDGIIAAQQNRFWVSARRVGNYTLVSGEQFLCSLVHIL